jgi:hypothetical protein
MLEVIQMAGVIVALAAFVVVIVEMVRDNGRR